LGYAADPEVTSNWGQGCKTDTELGIQGEPAQEWNQYTQRLKLGYIKFKKEEDEIVWSKNKTKLQEILLIV